MITINGIITDADSLLQTGFNGTLSVTVYEKSYFKTTLVNDPGSVQTEVEITDSILIKTECPVQFGEFEFQFVLPENSLADFGNIKLSYYANNTETDAAGYFTGIITGGEPSGVYENKIDNVVALYPTVSSDYINLYFNNQVTDVNIYLYDIHGNEVYSDYINGATKGEKYKIDIQDLMAGAYIVTVIVQEYQKTFKVMKF
ncbi:MAG: T9SS type A sorting domain-containing protein [Bacteroidales bacterium]|nr:T9SS type A sorting domain-containing protein [Bacteroidales bacterium]